MSWSPRLDLLFLSVVTSKQPSLKTQTMLSSPGWVWVCRKHPEVTEKDYFSRCFLIHVLTVEAYTPESIKPWVWADKGRGTQQWIKQWNSESLCLLFSFPPEWEQWCAVCSSWGMLVVFVSQTGSLTVLKDNIEYYFPRHQVHHWSNCCFCQSQNYHYGNTLN